MELVVGQKYKVKYLGPEFKNLIGKVFEAKCISANLNDHNFDLPEILGCGIESQYWRVEVIELVTETKTESDDGSEIRSGLKTWEMLKLTDEHPEYLVTPEQTLLGGYFKTIGEIDVSPFIKSTWSVKIPPKKVSITRKELIAAWDKIPLGKLDRLEAEISLASLVKELGL